MVCRQNCDVPMSFPVEIQSPYSFKPRLSASNARKVLRVCSVSFLSALAISMFCQSPQEAKEPSSSNKTAAGANPFASGVSLYGQKNFKEAAQQFELAMQANPNNADAVYYCALSHQQSYNAGRARQLFEYITQRFPQSGVATNAQKALSQLSAASSSRPSSSSSASSSAQFDPDANVPDLVRIPYEKKGDDVLVQMQVNGRPAQFCLDTGAGAVSIGMNHLKDWGVNSQVGRNTYSIGGVGDGQAKGWIQQLDLKLGPIYRRGFPCSVQDNMPTEPLLGQTFLRAFNVSIDENNRVVLLAKKAGRAAKDIVHRSYGAKEIPFKRSAGGHMWIDAQINGKPIKMVFDTGAEQTAFSSDDWQKLGFTIPDSAQKGTSRGVLGDAVSYFFTADSIKVGGVVQESAPIHVTMNSKAPPLLGMSFFSRYKVAIDTVKNVVVLTEQ